MVRGVDGPSQTPAVYATKVLQPVATHPSLSATGDWVSVDLPGALASRAMQSHPHSCLIYTEETRYSLLLLEKV